MPVVARGPEVGDFPLHMCNLMQQLTVDIPINAESVVERQRCVECETSKVGGRIQVFVPLLAIIQELFDADERLEVKNWHVRLGGRTVQSSGGSLSAVLARLVPRRGADGKTLRC